MAHALPLSTQPANEELLCPRCLEIVTGEICSKHRIPGIASAWMDPNEPLQGRNLDGRHTLLHRIAWGATAEVHAAWDSRSRKIVAVKLIRQELAADPTIIERFRREVLVLRRLEHDGIVRMIGAGRSVDNRVFIVLERLDGFTIEQLVESTGKLSVGRALNIAGQICRALELSHERGFVHRDMKPANVIIESTSEGEDCVKVVDYGISRNLGEDPGDELISAGKMLGSPCYAAPEQARLGTLDARTDLYALGIICYEMLTGTLPFEDPNPVNVLRAQVTAPVPPLPESIPTAVCTIVESLLAKDPAHRPQTARSVAKQLERLQALHETPAPMAAPIPIRNPLRRSAAKEKRSVDNVPWPLVMRMVGVSALGLALGAITSLATWTITH
jgi:serine/threonine-protein kinase